MRVCIGFQGEVWNRLKIQENSEKFRKIRKNSEKFRKIRKNSEKFRKIWKKIRKNRGTKHKKWGNLWSLEAARAKRAQPEGGGSHMWPRGGTYIPYIPSTNSQEGVQSKNFSGGGVVLFFLPRGGYTRSYSNLNSCMDLRLLTYAVKVG